MNRIIFVLCSLALISSQSAGWTSEPAAKDVAKDKPTIQRPSDQNDKTVPPEYAKPIGSKSDVKKFVKGKSDTLKGIDSNKAQSQ